MIDGYAERIAKSVGAVQARMAAACRRAGRGDGSVTLLAVTKFNPAEAVLAAYAAGVRIFGENRVQEAESKFSSIAGSIPGATLHLLGHLQSNKARKAAALFDCIQSVDSEAIITELSRRASDVGRPLDVLFELHTGEESKSGFPDTDSLFRALDAASALPALRVRGLMTMAPYTDDKDTVRASFRRCADAFGKARAMHDPAVFSVLSMGMTNDFEIAIEEGATMIRIGTAIFGSRTYQ